MDVSVYAEVEAFSPIHPPPHTARVRNNSSEGDSEVALRLQQIIVGSD